MGASSQFIILIERIIIPLHLKYVTKTKNEEYITHRR